MLHPVLLLDCGCMDKTMLALHEYATTSSAMWLHGEKVDVSITTVCYNATCLHGEKVDVSIAGVCYNK